jgi:predicted tellurium resistance membrane protein TerC
VPLSEEELRLLEQMERALVEEDPKFASTLRGTSFRRAARRKALLAGVVFALGVTVLMTGAIMNIIPLGILGFVIMLASATYGLAVLRGHAPAAASTATERDHGSHGFSVIDGGRAGKSSRRSRRNRSSHTFMERMDERWRRRRDGGQGY